MSIKYVLFSPAVDIGSRRYTDEPGSWVMLHDQEGFVRLHNERLIYSSPPRTSLALTPPPSHKGNESLSFQSSAGCIYLTNQRVCLISPSGAFSLSSH